MTERNPSPTDCRRKPLLVRAFALCSLLWFILVLGFFVYACTVESNPKTSWEACENLLIVVGLFAIALATTWFLSNVFGEEIGDNPLDTTPPD